MRVILAGSGRALYYLARAFISKGHTLTVIDPDEREAHDLSLRLNATVVEGNPSTPAVLRDAQARLADLLLAVGPNDAENFAVGYLAHREYGIDRVVVVANDPDNQPVFTRLGLEAVSLAETMARLLEQRAVSEHVANLLPIREGQLNAMEVAIHDEAPAAWHNVSDLMLPPQSLIACLIRDQESQVPRGNTSIWPGDRLIVLCAPACQTEVLEALVGKE